MSRPFTDLLNAYMERLSCTPKELADASSLSVSTLIRYQKGIQIPGLNGKALALLSQGIASLSEGALSGEQVFLELTRAITGLEADYPSFQSNFGRLMSSLSISNNDIARALSFDPSFISRIQKGQRRPASLPDFIQNVAGYVARHRTEGDNLLKLSSLTGASAEELSAFPSCREAVIRFLGRQNAGTESGPLGDFLQKLDAFDLNAYMSSISFDPQLLQAFTSVPTKTGICRGLSEMKKAELDFLKETWLSSSEESVVLYSDMPLSEMAEDVTFYKMWSAGIALLLKKGLRLHIVHDVHRPLPEMLMGLMGWIPLYMTGLISPWYLDTSQGDVFLHLLRSSGSIALSGEAIASHHGQGLYYLTTEPDMVSYYRTRGKHLLSLAKPLMKIFRRENAAEYESQLLSLLSGGSLRCILSALPIFTMSEELLTRIFVRCGLSPEETSAAKEYRGKMNAAVRKLLEDGHTLTLEYPELQREVFTASPAALPLADLFFEKEVCCTWDEYQEHLALTRRFAAQYSRLVRLAPSGTAPFRNIQIRIMEDRFALVSKSSSPSVHFLIQNPQLVAAFSQFSLPGKE